MFVAWLKEKYISSGWYEQIKRFEELLSWRCYHLYSVGVNPVFAVEENIAVYGSVNKLKDCRSSFMQWVREQLFFFYAVDVNGFFGWMYDCFLLRHLSLSC